MPDIDLDAIEAMTSDPYQYVQTSPLVTRGYLTALLVELRATTGDLAVAVEVARERGEEVERLRDDVFTLRADARMADDISRDRARERAEITRLRAVAEAAGDLIDCDPDTAQLDYLIELEDAVNAWRAGGGAS